MSHASPIKMEPIEARIDMIERERTMTRWALRTISLSATIFVVFTSFLCGVNSYITLASPAWYLSVISGVAAVVDLIVEYGIRRRMGLIEGRSAHIIEIRKCIAGIIPILERGEIMRNEPTMETELSVSTQHELMRMRELLDEHLRRLTFDESLYSVVAHGPA